MKIAWNFLLFYEKSINAAQQRKFRHSEGYMPDSEGKNRLPENRFPDTPSRIAAAPFGYRQRNTDRATAVDEAVRTARYIMRRLIAGRIAEQYHRHHARRQTAQQHELMDFSGNDTHLIESFRKTFIIGPGIRLVDSTLSCRADYIPDFPPIWLCRSQDTGNSRTGTR